MRLHTAVTGTPIVMLTSIVVVTLVAATTAASTAEGSPFPTAADPASYTASVLALERQFLAMGKVAGPNRTAESPRKRRPFAFACPPLAASPSTPTSVHELRPGDIGVVSALGDSITAGFGERIAMADAPSASPPPHSDSYYKRAGSRLRTPAYPRRVPPR